MLNAVLMQHGQRALSLLASGSRKLTVCSAGQAAARHQLMRWTNSHDLWQCLQASQAVQSRGFAAQPATKEVSDSPSEFPSVRGCCCNVA